MDLPRVAVAVNTFLGYTNAWVHRQVVGEASEARLVLCKKRDCEEQFPFEPVVACADRTPRLLRKIRGKLWPLFRHFPPRPSPRQKRAFAAALREHRIDLVHAHFGMVGCGVAPVCRSLRIPLIVTTHGYDVTAVPRRWPAYVAALRRLFDECPFFIVVSEDMKGKLIDLGCRPEKIRVSYLGVPIDEFAFVDRSQRTGPVRFLHAGRLTAKKGVPDLVRAFAQAFPEPGMAVLDIVGNGEEETTVKEMITPCAPANPVNLFGRANQEQIRQHYAQADAFVLNSREAPDGSREGLPISTLEAAATGLPALSTYHAGIPESIRHGETGLLVQEFDQDALVDALRQMADRERRLTMGHAARAFMEERFALDKCNARLGEMYREAMAIGMRATC
jgi:colanic acid/amylovoran biosynthesis glycosyltransferase